MLSVSCPIEQLNHVFINRGKIGNYQKIPVSKKKLLIEEFSKVFFHVQSYPLVFEIKIKEHISNKRTIP